MQGIFVSYRRQDSQSAAGRLSDHLRDRLGEVPIFRDVETISPGVDFVEAIERALKSCAILIAVIGPRWAGITDATGRRRLDDPNDYTRQEIATALRRREVRVIPVLVEGATMPAAGELPEDLQALARRNAIELSDKRWDYDVSELLKTLREVLGLREPEPQRSPGPAPESRKSRKVWFIVAAVVVLGIVGAALEGTDSGPIPAPMPVAMPVPDLPQANAQLNLTGMWADSAGGQHRILQQGDQVAVEGFGPDGVVVGRGALQGNNGWISYTLNGYALNAQFTVSRDGTQLDALVTDPGTGQRTPIRMWRTQ